MTPHELKQRTKRFAIDIIKVAATLPRGITADVINRQLVKAGTGVAANYRSSCRAKSRKDFVVKLTTAAEEADESGLWLEILSEAEIVRASAVARLLDEADQLTRIFVASIITARKRKRSEKNQQSEINN